MPISATEYPADPGTEGACTFDSNNTADIWIGRIVGNTVTLNQIDPATGAVLNSYAIVTLANANGPGAITFMGGLLWYATEDNFLLQIDPATGLLLAQFPIDTTPGDTQASARGVANDGVFLYVSYDAFDGTTFFSAACRMTSAGAITWVSKFSPTFNGPSNPVVTGDDVWINNRFGAQVFRLALATGAVENTVPIPGAVLGPMDTQGTALTVLDFNGFIYQIDTDTAALTGPFPVPNGNFPVSVQYDSSGNIWIVDQDNNTGVYDVLVFNPITAVLDTLITDLTDNAGGLAFDTISNRMWTPALDALSNNIVLAMGFGAPAGAGGMFGTFVGVFNARHTGGGTK